MSFDLEKLVRANIKTLQPYSSARDEFEGEASVFLDANENPYSASYNRYPDPHQKKLKRRIASIKNTIEEQIFLGNGSDEAIDLLIRAFCEPGVDEVIIPQPTYGMYSVCAALNDIRVNTIALTSGFDLDADTMLQAITPNTKLIFLCSPNNPSGNLLSPEQIERVLGKFEGLMIVDEAYIDFCSSPGFVSRLNEFPNLVILQTLSKAWGLAGIRIGMCFASKEIISVLNKIKAPYNISQAAQAIALEQLEKTDAKESQVLEILSQRKFLMRELSSLKFVEKVYPSDANFVLARFNNARRVYQALLNEGIVVRDRSTILLCNNCLRITIGTPAENKILLEKLSRL